VNSERIVGISRMQWELRRKERRRCAAEIRHLRHLIVKLEQEKRILLRELQRQVDSPIPCLALAYAEDHVPGYGFDAD
jgi:hypothetical protein